MQKSKRVAILATVLLLLPLELLILFGMWPYLPLVGKAFAGMLITFCVCGAVYVVALTYQRITAPRLIVERDVVVMLARDGYIHLSAEHEAAKLPPLQLAGPKVEVTEAVPGEVEPDHWRILELAGKGMALRDIALACNTTYYKVQKITSAWNEKMAKSG